MNLFSILMWDDCSCNWSVISCRLYLVVTLPAEALAKYCGVYICVCVCVCLSVHEDISRTAHMIFTECFMHVVYGRGSVLLQRHCDMLLYFQFCG